MEGEGKEELRRAQSRVQEGRGRRGAKQGGKGMEGCGGEERGVAFVSPAH